MRIRRVCCLKSELGTKEAMEAREYSQAGFLFRCGFAAHRPVHHSVREAALLVRPQAFFGITWRRLGCGRWLGGDEAGKAIPNFHEKCFAVGGGILRRIGRASRPLQATLSSSHKLSNSANIVRLSLDATIESLRDRLRRPAEVHRTSVSRVRKDKARMEITKHVATI